MWLNRLHEAQEKYKEANSSKSGDNQDSNNNTNTPTTSVHTPRRTMSLKKLRSPKTRAKRSSTVSTQETSSSSRNELSPEMLGFPLERKAISLSNNAIPISRDQCSSSDDESSSDKDRRVSDPSMTPAITLSNPSVLSSFSHYDSRLPDTFSSTILKFPDPLDGDDNYVDSESVTSYPALQQDGGQCDEEGDDDDDTLLLQSNIMNSAGSLPGRPRFSPSRSKKHPMLKAIHEKSQSQSIDAVYI